MAPKDQGFESIVNADEESHTILKTIGDYIANNQMLTTGMVLWLPRLLLFASYTIDFKGIIDDDTVNNIEHVSWVVASLSYVPWGLHGAGLKTYREALEYRRENGLGGLAIATIKGLGKEVKFMFWDMPTDIIYKAPQYLAHLYDKAIKKELSGTKN